MGNEYLGTFLKKQIALPFGQVMWNIRDSFIQGCQLTLAYKTTKTAQLAHNARCCPYLGKSFVQERKRSIVFVKQRF